LHQQDEESLASQTGGYAPDVLAEIEKLNRCDLPVPDLVVGSTCHSKRLGRPGHGAGAQLWWRALVCG